MKEQEELEDAQAKVNAEYLERIANITTGWKEYEKILDEARAADLKRQTEFHEMVDHMRSAGASLKEISAAELEFKKQELSFQSQILKLKKEYSKGRSIYDQDVQEAKTALDMYRKETQSEKLKSQQMEKSHNEKELEVQEEVDKKFQAKSAAWRKDNGIVKYQKDLQTEGSSDADKVSKFEEKIQAMKQKELLHDAKRQQQAKDEVEKSEKEAAQAKALKAGRLHQSPTRAQTVLKGKAGMDKVLNTLLKSGTPGSPGAASVRVQELATAAKKAAAGEHAATPKEDPWVNRRAAFFRAMNEKAKETQAKFETLLHHGSAHL